MMWQLTTMVCLKETSFVWGVKLKTALYWSPLRVQHGVHGVLCSQSLTRTGFLLTRHTILLSYPFFEYAVLNQILYLKTVQRNKGQSLFIYYTSS